MSWGHTTCAQATCATLTCLGATFGMYQVCRRRMAVLLSEATSWKSKGEGSMVQYATISVGAPLAEGDHEGPESFGIV